MGNVEPPGDLSGLRGTRSGQARLDPRGTLALVDGRFRRCDAPHDEARVRLGGRHAAGRSGHGEGAEDDEPERDREPDRVSDDADDRGPDEEGRIGQREDG